MTDLDQQSVEELFALGLATSWDDEEDDRDYYQSEGDRALWELMRRGTPEIFETARAFCQSSVLNERRVGVYILAQLGYPQNFPYRAETVPLLLQMLELETDPIMLNTLAVALGHIDDERAIPLLLKLKRHPDAAVRFGVAFGLLTHEDPNAIAALIELSADSDSDVRDWATFGLGTQLDIDTEAIREALFARLSDTDDAARDEAIVGLAKRKDQRVFEPLLIELECRNDWSVLDFEAAEELADARLLPALYKLQESGFGAPNAAYGDLLDAIAACKGQPDTHEDA